MAKNPYIEDAKYFLKFTSNQIRKTIEDENLIQIVLNFALGIERILKGILYDVNPIYVLINQDFENSFPVLYKDKMVNNCKEDKVIRTNPTGDVLTLKNSLIRAQFISQVVFENKTTIYKLNDFRDTIAHCELKSIDFSKLRMLIYRDFYPLIRAFSDELQVPKSHFFDTSSARIANISSNYQEELKDQIKLKIEASTEYWESIRNNVEKIEIAKTITLEQFALSHTMEVKCPCCGNPSILYIEPEYEKGLLIDYRPIKYICKYCRLKLDDYSQIDDLIMPLLFDFEQIDLDMFEELQ